MYSLCNINMLQPQCREIIFTILAKAFAAMHKRHRTAAKTP